MREKENNSHLGRGEGRFILLRLVISLSRVRRFYFDGQWFNFDFRVGQSSSMPRQTKKTEEIRQKSDKIKLNRLEI